MVTVTIRRRWVLNLGEVQQAQQYFGELPLQLHTAVQVPPTQFHFFKVLFEGVVASARVLTEMLKAPDAPSNNASSG